MVTDYSCSSVGYKYLIYGEDGTAVKKVKRIDEIVVPLVEKKYPKYEITQEKWKNVMAYFFWKNSGFVLRCMDQGHG